MENKLKELRKKARITTTEMAENLGICPGFYSQLENNTRTLSYQRAVLIAEIFDKNRMKFFTKILKKE